MAVIISAQTAEFMNKIGQAENKFSRFSATVGNVTKGLGLAFGAREIFQGLQYGMSVVSDFEASMSEVRAITGATGDEFQKLEKDALRLGAATKFTAKEVSQLQVAYGRLGFTTKEILQATKATLDLAAATGEDLAKSADVAGSTVRGFGLNAVQTQRVVDVMASSFNKTALGLDNFAESMKYVAPVAAAAGASVEETTAMLGTLADAGIRGSMAGTSLRKIFTDMSKDGRPLSERLAELAKKGITMSDAFDEVGRTAQTSLLILANNTDKTNALAAAFQNVEGEAAKMARTMSDNLTGDVTKLSSAWDGLILKIGSTSFWRQKTQQLTSFINALSGTNDVETGLRQLTEAIVQTTNDGVIDEFTAKLADMRREAGEPIDLNIVQELAEKYKLTSEQANKLYQSVLKANEALSFQEKAIQQFKDFAQRNGYEDLIVAVDDYKQRLYELIFAEQQAKASLEKYTPELKEDIKQRAEQIAAYRRVILILNEYASGLDKVTKKQDESNKSAVLSIGLLKDRLKLLNEEFDAAAISQKNGANTTDTPRLRMIAAEIAGLDQEIKRLEMIKKLMAEDTSSVKGLKKGSALNAFAIDIEAVNKRVEQGLINLQRATATTTTNIKAEYLDLSGAIAGSISSIADALGQSIVTRMNWADTILKTLATFAKQVGETLIGIGTAMLAARAMITNPITAIGAGIALVALAGALSAGLSSAQASFNGGGGSSGAKVSRTNSLSPQRYIGLMPAGKTVIEGRDLVLIYDKNKTLDVKRKSG
jgi:hypothetical protein